MFLRYDKISMKTVKIHDAYFWKISLRVLWNHVMNNFQLKHGVNVTASYSQNIFF